MATDIITRKVTVVIISLWYFDKIALYSSIDRVYPMAIDKENDLNQRKAKVLEDITNGKLINYFTIEQKAIILDLIYTDVVAPY